MSSFVNTIKDFFSNLFGGSKKCPSSKPVKASEKVAKPKPGEFIPVIINPLPPLKILNNRKVEVVGNKDKETGKPGEIKPDIVDPLPPVDDKKPGSGEEKPGEFIPVIINPLPPLKILNNRKVEVVGNKDKETGKPGEIKPDIVDPLPPADDKKSEVKENAKASASQSKAKKPAPKKKK